MGLIRKIALVVLSISCITFIALFGRLPAFRNTPVGYLHRQIWILFPAFLQKVDRQLFSGKLTPLMKYAGHHLMNEKHPLVLAFFLTTLLISEILFIPSAWPRLSNLQRVTMSTLVISVYIFIYLSAATSPGFITPQNHARALNLFPYDSILYHPSIKCSTCLLPKPARSKHCRICGLCVAKLDHHCVWINNCVGHANSHYFMLMLLSTSLLLSHGAWLGYTLTSAVLQRHAWTPDAPWSRGLGWLEYLEAWGWGVTHDSRVGAVALLAAFTAPLAWGLLAYHAYLVWSGMTTNEHAKWKVLQDEALDGEVWAAKWTELRGLEGEAWTALGIAGLKGAPPSAGLVVVQQSRVPEREHARLRGGVWKRLEDLDPIRNIYDRGLRENIWEVFLSPAL